jgi:ATP/maltotriose-dependent transcriptional regulator MalT
MHRELENAGGVLVCLNNLAVLNREQGHFAAASSLFLEIVQLLRGSGDQQSMAHAISNLADVARAQGDFGRALALHGECLAIFRGLGDAVAVGWSLNHQADIARAQGDVHTAGEFMSKPSRSNSSFETAGRLEADRAANPAGRFSCASRS